MNLSIHNATSNRVQGTAELCLNLIKYKGWSWAAKVRRGCSLQTKSLSKIKTKIDLPWIFKWNPPIVYLSIDSSIDSWNTKYQGITFNPKKVLKQVFPLWVQRKTTFSRRGLKHIEPFKTKPYFFKLKYDLKFKYFIHDWKHDWSIKTSKSYFNLKNK